MAGNISGGSGTSGTGQDQNQEEKKIFKWLETINTNLASLNEWVDAVFDDMGNYGQEGVDAICAYVGEVVSYHVNYMKATALNALHEQYLGQSVIIEQLEPAVKLVEGEPITNPEALFEILVAIFKPWLKPYETAINFMKELVPELEKFAENIQKIASHRPTINVPGISLDSFKLDITTPTIDQVIAGSVPYPDPPKPFTPPKPAFKKKKELEAEAQNPIKVSGTSDLEGLA